MEVVLLLVLSVHMGIALVSSGHALIHRPTPRSALLWITFLWFLPILTPVLYLIFGVDRIHRRALLKGRTRAELRRLYPGVSSFQGLEHRTHETAATRLLDIHVVATKLSKVSLLQSNHFQLLRDGEETFPAMLADIDGAKQSVNLMTYIFDEDPAGHDILDALGRAADRDVPARLLFDAAGCVATSKAFFAAARERGVMIEPFFPLNPLARRAQLNLRNHRKVLVVDGTVGYFGGINISSRHYFGDETIRGRCRDLHVRAEGPVVRQLQEVFAEDWYFAVGEELLSPRHFPILEAVGSSYGRVVTSGPDDEQFHLQLLLFAAIGAARRSIRLVSPYFIPEGALEFALRTAAMRGVRTEVYFPAETDHPMTRRAAYANLRPLVEAGVRVYEMAPPFVHAKAYLIDDEWALMGSANLDPRSFSLNYEVLVEMSRTKLIDELIDWILEMRHTAREITLTMLLERPLRSRLLDHFANLFGPIL